MKGARKKYKEIERWDRKEYKGKNIMKRNIKERKEWRGIQKMTRKRRETNALGTIIYLCFFCFQGLSLIENEGNKEKEVQEKMERKNYWIYHLSNRNRRKETMKRKKRSLLYLYSCWLQNFSKIEGNKIQENMEESRNTYNMYCIHKKSDK